MDIFLLPILVLLSGDRCRDGSCLPRPQRVTGQEEVVYTCSAARPKNRPAAVFLNLTSLKLSAAALGGVKDYKNCHLLGIVDILEL